MKYWKLTPWIKIAHHFGYLHMIWVCSCCGDWPDQCVLNLDMPQMPVWSPSRLNKARCMAAFPSEALLLCRLSHTSLTSDPHSLTWQRRPWMIRVSQDPGTHTCQQAFGQGWKVLLSMLPLKEPRDQQSHSVPLSERSWHSKQIVWLHIRKRPWHQAFSPFKISLQCEVDWCFCEITGETLSSKRSDSNCRHGPHVL